MNILKRISFKDANGITVTGTVLSAYNAGTVLFPDWCVEFTRDTPVKGYANYCNLSQVRDGVSEVKLWCEVWVSLYAFRPTGQGAGERLGGGGIDWFWCDKSKTCLSNFQYQSFEFPEDEFTFFSLKVELPYDNGPLIDEIDTYTYRYIHGFTDRKLHWFEGKDAA